MTGISVTEYPPPSYFSSSHAPVYIIYFFLFESLFFFKKYFPYQPVFPALSPLSLSLSPSPSAPYPFPFRKEQASHGFAQSMAGQVEAGKAPPLKSRRGPVIHLSKKLPNPAKCQEEVLL